MSPWYETIYSIEKRLGLNQGISLDETFTDAI